MQGCTATSTKTHSNPSQEPPLSYMTVSIDATDTVFPISSMLIQIHSEIADKKKEMEMFQK